ncbi:PH domain-containing protein [Apilactobacillus apisilvae]|uniref:PH domain-containing protein n=1 Tax=Apilactobacillus apisilvae TaxID=2923364 RepID=A0ABY4PG59_9LACO|nr:PH domain-containing protein [Apilactobacillus apisilvae]UQS84504.1 PH domain-containing protein [Apilactobacillus apisilvae]
MKNLPSSVKKIWMQSSLITFVCWMIAFFCAILFLPMFHWPVWVAYIILGIASIELASSLALIPYRYAFNQYKISEEYVEIQKGFFFRKLSSIPIARVQNVNLSQGPLLRFQKLNSVHIDTAGDNHKIEAVTHQEAEAIRKQVMDFAMEARNEK